jgi:hypothetical protein
MATQMEGGTTANGKHEPKLHVRRFGAKGEWCLAILLLFTPLSQRFAYAQVDTGSIVGNVADASGASVPGATLTIADEATGRTQIQQSGQDGSYIFSPLKIGFYTLTVAKTGFET